MGDFWGVGGRDDQDHANAHVENLIHFVGRDGTFGLDDAEDGGDFPEFAVDDGIEVAGEDAWGVVHESSTGDVGCAFQCAVWEAGEKGLVIGVDAEEFFTERPP